MAQSPRSFGVPLLFPVVSGQGKALQGIQDQTNPQGVHGPGEEVSMNTANPKSGHGITWSVEGPAESLGEGNHCL